MYSIIYYSEETSTFVCTNTRREARLGVQTWYRHQRLSIENLDEIELLHVCIIKCQILYPASVMWWVDPFIVAYISKLWHKRSHTLMNLMSIFDVNGSVFGWLTKCSFGRVSSFLYAHNTCMNWRTHTLEQIDRHDM